MRIVAGQHKGRTLVAPRGSKTRPTSERAREAIFNVLAHGIDWSGLAGARVLDVFAGSGALGLEAISRGAAHCTFIENSRPAIDAITANISGIGEEARTRVIKSATDKAPTAGQAVNIAFLDAPYKQNLSVPALVHLGQAGWFGNKTVIVVEIASDEKIEIPAGFRMIKEKTYGAARTLFLGYGNGN